MGLDDYEKWCVEQDYERKIEDIRKELDEIDKELRKKYGITWFTSKFSAKYQDYIEELNRYKDRAYEQRRMVDYTKAVIEDNPWNW